MSTQSFADLGVSDAVVRALADRGITEPFAIQRLVIGDVLAGRDVLVKSPTGSGKTLAFGDSARRPHRRRRPAARRRWSSRPRASSRRQIVEETRSIAHARALQDHRRLRRRRPRQAGPRGRRRRTSSSRRPGRLEDLLERRAFSLSNVRIPRDRRGRPHARHGLPARRRPDRRPRARAERQTMFFSATLEGEAGRVAREYTREPVRARARASGRRREAADRAPLRRRRAATDRVEALVAELRAKRGLALVFVRTKRGADRLVKRLDAHGVDAVAMHGNKSQRQREQALARFEAGRVDTLVATDVAARGIDVDGISHVINFDPPDDREGYVHRVGRTGRAGRTGIGITLVGADQAHEVRHIARPAEATRRVRAERARRAPRVSRAAHQAHGRPPRRPPPAPRRRTA